MGCVFDDLALILVAFFDVFEDFGVDFGFGEGFDFWDLAIAGDFAGDVEVVVEFDAWMGGEKKNFR